MTEYVSRTKKDWHEIIFKTDNIMHYYKIWDAIREIIDKERKKKQIEKIRSEDK